MFILFYSFLTLLISDIIALGVENMGLKAGIIGMPNVGKSTLFNAITLSNVEAANYPFATIEPNSGVVEVMDKRIDDMIPLYNPRKVIRATLEFVDIAGLVKGASKGEGLGNKFLANIRETDAICHVVRCFKNSEILHVEGDVDSLRDVEIINYELALADLEVVEKRIEKVAKKAMTTKDKDAVFEYETLMKIKNALVEGNNARSVELNDKELDLVKSFNLLSLKPIIYVANLNESEVNNPMSNEEYNKLVEYAKKENSLVIPVTAQIEADLAGLEPEEKQEFLNELGLEESGLDKLTKAMYSLLGLETYFTAGTDELRAWTFKSGMKAPECAGIIHSDFQRGFIKAEVYSYEDIMLYKSELKVKENGKLRMEGKEYLVKDGDIMFFKFNV